MPDEFPGSERYSRPERVARFDAGAPQRPRTLRRRRRERRSVELLLGRMPSLGAPVLDVPCGAGRFASLWKAHGLRAVQVDLSTAMTRVARLARMPTAVGSAFTLPFPDRHFDLVLCMRFFHHLGAPEAARRAWNELARVSRRALLVSFLHPCSAHGLTRRVMRLLGKPSTRISHRLSFFSRLAADSGFRLTASAADGRYLCEHWLALFERE